MTTGFGPQHRRALCLFLYTKRNRSIEQYHLQIEPGEEEMWEVQEAWEALKAAARLVSDEIQAIIEQFTESFNNIKLPKLSPPPAPKNGPARNPFEKRGMRR